MLIATIVGARPQFIKEAAVGRVLRQKHREILIHTGQHFDPEMSDVFFEELQIARPDYNLGIGGGSHGDQTGRMLSAIEAILVKDRPDAVLVYGDTNSTLAGALAAVKLHVPIAHVEAGLRSRDRRMPEEINRVLTDHASDLLFAPTRTAMENLRLEGIVERARLTGDVMADVLAHNLALARKRPILKDLGLAPKQYYVATLHRPANVDDPAMLAPILTALDEADLPVVLPMHPRTRNRLQEFGIKLPSGSLRVIAPQGYLEFLALEADARRIITDSGGIQKEAYLLKVPCITVRDVTEWIETVDDGWNILVGNDSKMLKDAIASFTPSRPHRDLFGRNAADDIVRMLPELARK
ncbi:MAG: non-hydrolyzing UDP-N-acetylglucosamine 2-epimerase [Thermoplasmatota archaeon]